MEALAAVSLAGSILQFTDFTTSVVSKTKEFYITTSGSLKEYDDLHSITIHLKNLSDRLSCQDSTGYTDPLLDTISSRCSQAVEELLFALDTLAVEGQNTRLKSFRKALKCLWGKEKVLTFTRRVGGFRQDLMLHVTANLRDRFNVMALEQTESFQRLDNATKCAIAQVLEALEVNRSHFVQIIDVQTEKIQTLHADAEENLTLEIESATATLEEQNQRIHRECSEQQERTRAEVLGAITEASSAYDRSLYRSNADFSVRAREEHKRTRLNIGQKLDNNREIMKREVHGIQHGMQQLHLVLDQKAEELKELMIKLNTAREDPQRPMLEYGGNRVTFITIVSEYLYNSLYKQPKPLIQLAKVLFGCVQLGSTIARMDFKSDVDVPASMMSEGYLDISMPMYNALHYQPLFNWPISRSGRPEILSITVPNKWMEVLNSVTKSNEQLSTALRIAIDLAQSRDQFVWTLTILVAALNAYLPQGPDLILRTVLNVRYDPTCVFPAFDSSDVGIPFLLVSDLPNSVRRYFRCGAPPNEVRKPRFGFDSAMGRRLTEDIVLLTELGRKSGLIEHFRQAADERKAGLENQRIPWFSPADSLADFTLALIGLLSQSPPWKIRSIRSMTDSPPGHRVHFHDQCLYIDARVSLVRALLCEMQLAGIVMDMIDIEAIDLAACSSNLDHIDIRFRDAWLESMTYADIVKSETWSPSAEASREWLHSYEMKGEIGGGEHDGVEVPCGDSDSGLLPPILRPDDFDEFIPMFKTHETPERIKQKNNMKAFSGMIPKLSPGSMASIPTDFPHGGFHYEGQ